jgi:hypothetical protein
VEGSVVKIKNDNFRALSQLCDEFGFQDLAAQLSEFRASDDFKEQTTTEDLEARRRLSVLEERMHQRDQEIVALRCEVSRQSRVQELAVEALHGSVTRLEAEVSALRTAAVSARTAAPAPPSPVSPAPALTPPPQNLTSPSAPPPSVWESAIVSIFPKILGEFCGNKFSLLWRGSRDGFKATQFHCRCDGHANTLTLILDTNGNIFGGFTPVEWESSRKGKRKKDPDEAFQKADPSQKSFLFTLKNPRNVSARRFALKDERKDEAICCDSNRGPDFSDMTIEDNCNANPESFTYLGDRYTNDTGLNGKTFFTGSDEFQVKEIEVFEITA